MAEGEAGSLGRIEAHLSHLRASTDRSTQKLDALEQTTGEIKLAAVQARAEINERVASVDSRLARHEQDDRNRFDGVTRRLDDLGKAWRSNGLTHDEEDHDGTLRRYSKPAGYAVGGGALLTAVFEILRQVLASQGGG